MRLSAARGQLNNGLRSQKEFAMSHPRVIKKYPNRRLYDTTVSRYITLADIKDLVLGETEFVVIDKKSGTDITRCILLQVISDQEQNGDAVLTEEFLAQVIRSYGLDAPGIMAEHLEQNLRQFMAQQRMASAGEMVNPFPAETKNSLTSGP